MIKDKDFLTYNQQMKKLRDEKKISCKGTEDKQILCRAGYFNLVNGYKGPFINGKNGDKHIYLPGTDIKELYSLKQFDYDLRMHLLKYITKIEEEVRTYAAYKFDEVNNRGSEQWYKVEAYNTAQDMQNIIKVISNTYTEIDRCQQEYVKFYLDNHKFIPTWIMIKIIKFSTFIDFIQYSKDDVKKSLCNLYGIIDERGISDYKLLIGSLHWMRKIRNVCAHNERVYSMYRPTGRIKTKYLTMLSNSYTRENNQKLIDLIIYMKYYLDSDEYEKFLKEIKEMLINLKSEINIQAFEKVRADIGIKNISHFDLLIGNTKIIEYNKF